MDLRSLLNKMLMWIRGCLYTHTLIMNNKTVFVLNNQHIGDVCYSLAFIEAYKKSYNVEEIKILWNGKIKEVYDSFSGFSLYKMGEKAQRDILCYLMKSWHGAYLVREKRFIVTYTSFYMPSNEMETRKITVPKLLSEQAFGLLNDANIAYPRIKKINLGELIDKYKLVKGKTVILNPLALSMELPVELFNYIAKKLRESGFTVLTNLNGKDDIPLDGTIGVRLTLSEMYNLAEYCGCVVGVRSGFFDFIISATCHFYVFYNEHYSMKCAYSLKAWKTDNVIDEYVVGHSDWLKVANKMLADFIDRG